MKDDQYRIERDSMGELQVPRDALWGAQTQRAIENFPVSGLRMPRALIDALGRIKGACAAVNHDLGLLDASRADAIQAAAAAVAEGEHDAHFPLDVFQTGSGTSTNMNANEVIARLAGDAAGTAVHPNDHVNMSQSSNDVFPSAIQVSACLQVERQLRPALAHLAQTIERRASELDDVVKTGRTHLMDAMPVRLGQELGAWAFQIRESEARVAATLGRLGALPLGGTAVGTGINAPADFGPRAAAALAENSGVAFTSMENYFAGIASQDAAVELSGQIKTAAVSVTKIANDLRWMNSGPLAGLGEIALPALQPGSSIMPGKVNPVIPESVAMVCAQIVGNDTAITLAGQSGNFQLNVMLPLIACNLLQSIEILANACRILADKAIAGFTVNADTLAGVLQRNPVLVTALNRVIGYEQGAAIAKRAYAERRPLLEVALEVTGMDENELRRLLDPASLTRGGIPDNE